jgi:DHA1 family inner membrane transport protein
MRPVMRPAVRPAVAVGALLALSASTFCYVTTESLPIGLLQLIAADLRVSPSAVGALVTGYGIMVALTSVPLALLTRRIPRRLLLSVALAVFVAATVVSAASTSYAVLMAARAATALTHAVFWSVVAATAAGLFAPRVRGRVLAVLFTGSSMALVLGVPAGTWLGQQVGWRAAFLALSGLGLAALATIAALVPTAPPDAGHAATGQTPDRRRYAALLVVTVLVITGAFTAFTYVTEYLTGVAGFPAATLGPLLLIRGLAGLLGMGVAALVVDRGPGRAMIGGVALMAVSLLGMYLSGPAGAVTVALLALSGFAMSLIATSLQTLVLDVAPGSSDLASAGTSTAFNIGIAGGALVGAVLLPEFGVRSTALAGGVFAAAGLVVALAEVRRSARRGPAETDAPSTPAAVGA